MPDPIGDGHRRVRTDVSIPHLDVGTVTTTTPPAGGSPDGLGIATDSTRDPSSGGRVPSGVATGGVLPGISAAAARMFDPATAVALYDFDPSLAPNSVAFADVLRAMGNSPQAEPFVRQLVGYVRATFGIPIPEPAVQAMIQKPELLLQHLRLTPAQMKAAINSLHESDATDQLGLKPRAYVLPKHFDMAEIGAVSIAPPKDELAEVAPGLYRGSLRNPEVDDTEAKKRVVLAEVFDRLAENANVKAADRFSVEFNGHRITRLSEMVSALRDDGYVVNAHVAQMCANFADLMTQVDGEWKDVAAPLMIETPVETADGKPTALPAVHSELVITVSKGPDVKGDADMSCELKWYQGVPNTGFFPAGLYDRPDWIGHGEPAGSRFEGPDATQAIEIAGLYSDVINDLSDRLKIDMAAYGYTGVCIDSVAVVQFIMGRELTAWPMMISGDKMMGEVRKRLKDHINRQDNPEYRALLHALETLGNDAKGHAADAPYASESARMADSIPYAEDKEVMKATRDFRAAVRSGQADN